MQGSGLVFRAQCFGIRVSGSLFEELGFRVSGYGFTILETMFSVYCFLFSSVGFRVSGMTHVELGRVQRISGVKRSRMEVYFPDG